MSLELWLSTAGPDRSDGPLSVSFAVSVGDRTGTRHDLPEAERGILDLEILAYPTGKGELAGFHTVQRGPARARLADLETVIPLMRRIDRFLAQAREESEDASFPATVAAIASHLRVAVVKVREPDGSVREAKRGAAYVTALRYADRFLASRPKAA